MTITQPTTTDTLDEGVFACVTPADLARALSNARLFRPDTPDGTFLLGHVRLEVPVSTYTDTLIIQATDGRSLFTERISQEGGGGPGVFYMDAATVDDTIDLATVDAAKPEDHTPCLTALGVEAGKLWVSGSGDTGRLEVDAPAGRWPCLCVFPNVDIIGTDPLPRWDYSELTGLDLDQHLCAQLAKVVAPEVVAWGEVIPPGPFRFSFNEDGYTIDLGSTIQVQARHHTHITSSTPLVRP